MRRRFPQKKRFAVTSVVVVSDPLLDVSDEFIAKTKQMANIVLQRKVCITQDIIVSTDIYRLAQRSMLGFYFNVDVISISTPLD